MQEAQPAPATPAPTGFLNRTAHIILILASLGTLIFCWSCSEDILEKTGRHKTVFQIHNGKYDPTDIDSIMSAQTVRLPNPGQPWLRLSAGLYAIAASCSAWLTWLILRRKRTAFTCAKLVALLIGAAALTSFTGNERDFAPPIEPAVIIGLIWLFISESQRWKRISTNLARD